MRRLFPGVVLIVAAILAAQRTQQASNYHEPERRTASESSPAQTMTPSFLKSTPVSSAPGDAYYSPSQSAEAEQAMMGKKGLTLRKKADIAPISFEERAAKANVNAVLEELKAAEEIPMDFEPEQEPQSY